MWSKYLLSHLFRYYVTATLTTSMLEYGGVGRNEERRAGTARDRLGAIGEARGKDTGVLRLQGENMAGSRLGAPGEARRKSV